MTLHKKGCLSPNWVLYFLIICFFVEIFVSVFLCIQHSFWHLSRARIIWPQNNYILYILVFKYAMTNSARRWGSRCYPNLPIPDSHPNTYAYHQNNAIWAWATLNVVKNSFLAADQTKHSSKAQTNSWIISPLCYNIVMSHFLLFLFYPFYVFISVRWTGCHCTVKYKVAI